ncbi:hypothetical protein DFS34DRAFT_620830 [Phlyctochytrium arcticum]|nr:hypothetical protein DFS34DRAFT_640798 [Phlyctochytrium arcticum]KAI9097208.1 hypothetical protein DFS34DRAFT_620830 [Phlyctochytrium arcticum]
MVESSSFTLCVALVVNLVVLVVSRRARDQIPTDQNADNGCNYCIQCCHTLSLRCFFTYLLGVLVPYPVPYPSTFCFR